MFRTLITGSILLLSLPVFAAPPADELVIHEWGTFTVLQDATGQALTGVNVNEEPLPAFAHRLYPGVVKSGHEYFPQFDPRSKGLPAQFSSATMRMETPVIYIYPPKGSPQPLDISVRFNGGWISEWYPSAKVTAPGFDKRRYDLGVLTPSTIGSVVWNDVVANKNAQPPATSHHVWKAPRATAAPVVQTRDGEAEKFLFYRGVANIKSPLRVVQDAQGQAYRIERNVPRPSPDRYEFKNMWLVDVLPDGAVAYVSFSRGTIAQTGALVATAPSKFSDEDYRPENLGRLKSEMLAALVADGLFKDEAAAMLKTWELSYFKSAGTRLFYTLPRKWTDSVLPMNVSRSADIERVMIGRVEVLNDRQRSLLKIINAHSPSNANWYFEQKDKLKVEEFHTGLAQIARGEKEAKDCPFTVPEEYVAYLRLGRFRDSIVANAARKKGNENIARFAANYRLRQR